MNRPFYSEYIRHALRYYTRSVINSNQAKPTFKTDADKQNWLACYSAVKDYAERDKDILISVYSGFDALPDEVCRAAHKYGLDQNIVWDMMKTFERKVARKRGLI